MKLIRGADEIVKIVAQISKRKGLPCTITSAEVRREMQKIFCAGTFRRRFVGNRWMKNTAFKGRCDLKEEVFSRVIPRSTELASGQTPRSTRITVRLARNPGNELVIDPAMRMRPGHSAEPFGVFL